MKSPENKHGSGEKIPTPEEVGVSPEDIANAGADSQTEWLRRHLDTVQAPEEVKERLLGLPVFQRVPEDRVREVIEKIDALVSNHKAEKARRLAELEAPRDQVFKAMHDDAAQATRVLRKRTEALQAKYEDFKSQPLDQELVEKIFQDKMKKNRGNFFRRTLRDLGIILIGSPRRAMERELFEAKILRLEAEQEARSQQWDAFSASAQQASQEAGGSQSSPAGSADAALAQYKARAQKELEIRQELDKELGQQLEALAWSVGESLDEDIPSQDN